MVTISESSISQMLRGLDIPPCPAVLAQLSAEMQREHGSAAHIADLISRDMALAAGVLKVVHSPLFGCARKITSINEALTMLGFKSVFNMVVSELLRKALSNGAAAPQMQHFWDRAAYTAQVSADLSKTLHGTSRDTAYSFGLFHDCGMPLLMRRFSGYLETIKQAGSGVDGNAFTAIEDAQYGTNHAIAGYLMAHNWALSETLSQAILAHHDFAIFVEENHLPEESLTLVALNFVAERITGLHLRAGDDLEWAAGRGCIADFFGLSAGELDDLVEDGTYRLHSAETAQMAAN